MTDYSAAFAASRPVALALRAARVRLHDAPFRQFGIVDSAVHFDAAPSVVADLASVDYAALLAAADPQYHGESAELLVSSGQHS